MKLLKVILTLALPFLVVWGAYLLTGFGFSPQEEVFNNGNFWGMSVVYWFVWSMLAPFIIDIIYENEKKS